MSDPTERFTVLYEDHWRAVYAYLVRRGCPRDDAADLVSDTFTTAWTRLGTVPSGRYQRSWLLATAKHHLANFRRKLSPSSEEPSIDGIGGMLGNPAEAFASYESQQQIWRALSSLPEMDRELVTLIAWDGLTPAQASCVLGVSRAAGRVRLHRARKKLATELGSDFAINKQAVLSPAGAPL